MSDLYRECSECEGVGYIQYEPNEDERCPKCGTSPKVGMVKVDGPVYRLDLKLDDEFGEPLWEQSEIDWMVNAGVLVEIGEETE